MIIKYFSLKDLHASANQLQNNVSTVPVLYFTMLSLITYPSLKLASIWLLVLCLCLPLPRSHNCVSCLNSMRLLMKFII